MNLKEAWNCGGGTQSVAIGILIIQGRLPKPDVSLIVDTGREKGSTWLYYDNWLKPALKEAGVDLVRVRKEDFATVDLWSKNGESFLLPAFSSVTDGEIGKMTNFCSHEWKTRVAHRYLRRTLGMEAKYRKWMGFSLEETRRWMKQRDNPLIRLPLVNDVPMRRQDCIDLVKSCGWPSPPRSACYMCPNLSNVEWLEIKTNRPWELEAASSIEKEAQKIDPNVWLHQSHIPIDQVVFEEPQTEEQRQCGSGECGI
jgi:hypothetical protein